MSVYDEVLQSIKELIEAVPDTGKVQIWERFSPKREDQLEHYMTTVDGQEQIRAWVVTLDENNPITTERTSYGLLTRTINLIIFGVLTLHDEDNTAGEFINMALAVMSALEGQIDAPTVLFDAGPVSMRLYQHQMFGKYLCHYGELAVPIVVDSNAP